MSRVRKTIDDVVAQGLCMGCGVCEAACPVAAIRVIRDRRRGLFVPVVDGKTWFVCNTHRAACCKSTLKGAIKAFPYIETTA